LLSHWTEAKQLSMITKFGPALCNSGVCLWFLGIDVLIGPVQIRS
jgi:hypothetical protein